MDVFIDTLDKIAGKTDAPNHKNKFFLKAFEYGKINRMKCQMWTTFRSNTKACRNRPHKLWVVADTHGKIAAKTINEESNHWHIINAIPHGIMENRFNQNGKFDELRHD